MRDLSVSMQAKLASGLTTFCHCWLLQRTDGVKIGFTDHDEDLTFEGVTYERLAGVGRDADALLECRHDGYRRRVAERSSQRIGSGRRSLRQRLAHPVSGR